MNAINAAYLHALAGMAATGRAYAETLEREAREMARVMEAPCGSVEIDPEELKRFAAHLGKIEERLRHLAEGAA